MNVSLTPELEAFVNKKVESGRYSSAGEVIHEALRLLEEREALRATRFAEFQAELDRRLAEADRGAFVSPRRSATSCAPAPTPGRNPPDDFLPPDTERQAGRAGHLRLVSRVGNPRTHPLPVTVPRARRATPNPAGRVPGQPAGNPLRLHSAMGRRRGEKPAKCLPVDVPRRDAPTPSACAGNPGGGAGARLAGSRRSPAPAGVLSQAAELVSEIQTRDIRSLQTTRMPPTDS